VLVVSAVFCAHTNAHYFLCESYKADVKSFGSAFIFVYCALSLTTIKKYFGELMSYRSPVSYSFKLLIIYVIYQSGNF
jgi:hypothetical protein